MSKNIFEKIQAVSTDIMNIEKDMTVGSGNYGYKAISDNVVVLAVKRAEAEHRLISIPIKQELINSEVLKTLKNNVEKLTYVDSIKMTLRIIDLDDTTKFVDVESYGKGIDNNDKGFGKASTYARKYALLNAYKIATGEDPESDKSEETKVKKEPDYKRLSVEDYLSKNISTKNEVFKHWGVDSASEMTDEQMNKTYDTFKKKGKL